MKVQFKLGDEVRRKSGELFRYGNTPFTSDLLKIRKIDGQKIWLEYRLGWINAEELEVVEG